MEHHSTVVFGGDAKRALDFAEGVLAGRGFDLDGQPGARVSDHELAATYRARVAGGSTVETRVLLAKTLNKAANLLLLDEPTNDLDVDTLRVLEEALLSFNGCAVVVSHDRWFLDRIATHILAFEGEGKVRWFEGNFQAYMEKRRQEVGSAAEQPKRIKYKKLGTG